MGLVVQLEDSMALAAIAQREGCTVVQLTRMLARIAELPPEQVARIAVTVVQQRRTKG